MTFSLFFSQKPSKNADTIAVGIYEGQNMPESTKYVDADHDKAITHALKTNASFKGKTGQMLTLSLNNKKTARIIVFGLGKKQDLKILNLDTIGGKLYAHLKSSSAETLDIYIDGIQTNDKAEAKDIAAHLAMGFKLKSYSFDKHKSKKDDEGNNTIDQITMITEKAEDSDKNFADYDATISGVFLARDLVNEAPNILHPESYADLIKKELKPLGVEIEILDEKKMQKMGFGALLAVGQGSIRESRVAIMRWNGAKNSQKSKAPIAFVGKGVTFDTGGISLKPGAEMDLMKMDMGGSAAVVGLMKALASRKANADVIGIVGLVENMPSDRAYRPGDIITSHAGKTIEVLNTDAEGRLVLADVLTYVQQTYKPEVIIDLATLTGAIMVALGFEYCGTFANDNDLWEQLEESSNNTGEKFWRMPLDEAYRKEMESDVADLRNLGSLGRYGGACSAAGFLEHFIEDGVKWAHIDIAGTAWWKTDKPTTPKGGTGFPVRALNDFVAKNFEK